jgi:CrcB protein
MNWLALAYVGFGGAIGSMARYALVGVISRAVAVEFPYATFAVNILGSGLMGVWIALIAVMMPDKARDMHLLIAVGALGGFTTFSAFSMDLFLLIERGLSMQAVAYACGSVLLSLFALLGGIWLVKMVAI